MQGSRASDMTGDGVKSDAALTLTEFLLARIAEDEATARAATPSPWVGAFKQVTAEGGRPIATVASTGRAQDSHHIEAWEPARVLAQCERDWRIVELHAIYGRGRGSCGTCTDRDYVGLVDEGPCDTLRLLALPYADHPDYRDEWRL